MRRSLAISLAACGAFAACSSSSTPVSEPTKPEPKRDAPGSTSTPEVGATPSETSDAQVSVASTAPDASAATLGPERRGRLQPDDKPQRSKFYGVFFVQDGKMRWVIDYRASALWKSFFGREVIVTGACYTPLYSAISAPHYHIATLRLADAKRGRGPWLTVGPEQDLRGELVDVAAPKGSKAEGSSRLVFRADGGMEYDVRAEALPTVRGRVKLRGRVVEPDMSYVARAGDIDFWLVGVLEPGDPDPTIEIGPATACP
jgi:hypothetical protein